MQRSAIRLEGGDSLITCDFGDRRYTVKKAGWAGPFYFLAWSDGDQEASFAAVPYDDVRFFAAAHQLTPDGQPKQISVLVGDTMQPVDWNILKAHMHAQTLASHPIWCLVANMVEERPAGPGGQEIKRGTSDIAPGAKVYCHPAKQGDGYERVQVAAHHRVSHRLITIYTAAVWLEQWRVELVYDPKLIVKLIHDWDWTPESKALAEELAELGKSWAKRNTSNEMR